jgi:hypothetical protein
MFLQEEPHGRNKVFRLKVTTQAVETVWAKSGGLRGKVRVSGFEARKFGVTNLTQTAERRL